MKFFRNLPIIAQQLIITIMVIISISVISLVTFSRISDMIVNRNIQYTNELVYQLKQNISSNYKEICTLLTNVGYDKTVQEFMMQTDPYEKLLSNEKISSILNIVNNVKTDLLDMEIIGINNSNISIKGGNSFTFQFKDSVRPDGKVYCSEFRQIDYDRTEDCFLYGMYVFSIDKDKMLGEKIGFVTAVVNAAAINNQLQRLPKLSGTEIYLIDRKGMMFYKNGLINIKENPVLKDINLGENNPVTRDISGKRCTIQIFELPDIGGKIVAIAPLKDLFAELSEIKQGNFLVLVIAFFLISIPLVMVVMNIVRPLKKLVDFMKSIKSGNLKNLKKRIQLEGHAEMSVVAREFNGMLDEIDALTHRLLDSNTRLYKIELEKKQSELAFLQSQINPHFLYNTLESIRGIAAAKGVSEIREMTGALSRIFRYSVKGTEEVSLQDEMEIVGSYVSIQQVRFQNRFDISCDLLPEALDCKVPKMILQPVVENAIYHGLEPTSRKGSLNIKCIINEDNELVISVRDNGIGMKPEKLEGIRKELTVSGRVEQVREVSSIGIVNVNNRLKLIYGEKYGINIESEVDQGTEVTFRIPAGRQ